MIHLDISGLPEPVQLALKVIKLEGTIQDRDVKIQSLEDSIMDLNNQTERLKRDHEFETTKQKKEMLFLKEKLDYKTNLDASTKGKTRPKDEKTSNEKQEIEKLKDDIQSLTETKDQVRYNLLFHTNMYQLMLYCTQLRSSGHNLEFLAK